MRPLFPSHSYTHKHKNYGKQWSLQVYILLTDLIEVVKRMVNWEVEVAVVCYLKYFGETLIENKQWREIICFALFSL